MANLDPFEQALIDEGILGTPLEAIARSTRMRESGGNVNAVSNRGAVGSMQVMPGTFGDMADAGWDINDPIHNTRAGIRYLKKAYEASGGDPKLTGAYYYGGPGGMEKAKRNIAVSDPQNPQNPTTLEYGQRLADDIAKALFPSAHAGTLPTPKTQGEPMKPQDIPVAQRAAAQAPVNSVLPQAMAALTGGVGSPLNMGQISPEALASLESSREAKAKMLPIALGALMSSNAGANSFGRVMAPQAMEALDPTRVGTSIITPDGQYIQGTGSQASSYYTPVQTGKGIMVFNNRTGQMEAAVGGDGQPIIGSQSDPALQGAIAGQKESGKAIGGAIAKNQIDAPKALLNAKYAVDLVDGLIKHPGREQATGMSRMMGVQHIPGTAAKDFDIALEQIKGQQFLEAFQSLKGGGQITEIEGQNATKALSRMQAAGSEEAFLSAAREFQRIMQIAMKRAEMQMMPEYAANGLENDAMFARNAPSYVSGQVGNVGGGMPSPNSGGLTPEEQAELDGLRKWQQGGR